MDQNTRLPRGLGTGVLNWGRGLRARNGAGLGLGRGLSSVLHSAIPVQGRDQAACVPQLTDSYWPPLVAE